MNGSNADGDGAVASICGFGCTTMNMEPATDRGASLTHFLFQKSRNSSSRCPSDAKQSQDYAVCTLIGIRMRGRELYYLLICRSCFLILNTKFGNRTDFLTDNLE